MQVFFSKPVEAVYTKFVSFKKLAKKPKIEYQKNNKIYKVKLIFPLHHKTQMRILNKLWNFVSIWNF